MEAIEAHEAARRAEQQAIQAQELAEEAGANAE
jgi:hypothetical protein